MSADEGSDERLAALVRGLETALVETFPRVRVVERALSLPGEGAADLVAIDESGRIVLVLVVDGQAEETCLVALDLLAHARANLKLLARHLDDPLVRTDLQPRVFLVSESFAERSKSRLGAVSSERLLLLEIRALETARGKAAYLVPLDPPTPTVEPPAAAIEDFLAGLSTEGRAIAGELVRRLGRLDRGLECAVAREEVHWRHQGRALCTVRHVEGRLEGLLPEQGRPLVLAGANEVEVFLERGLERYLELARDGTAEDLPAVERGPPLNGPILTQEELRAFQE